MYAGYKNRHKPVVLEQYKPEHCNNLLKIMCKKFKCHPQRLTPEEYVNQIDDKSKRKYYLDNLTFYYRTRRGKFHIVPFSKIEKMLMNKYKAPRLIQARHPIANILFGCYVRPIEKVHSKVPHFSRHYGKGDPDTVAERIYEKLGQYKFIYEADHSSFDAHVTVEMLKITHEFYARCYPQHATKIRALFKPQLRNKCISREGMKYRTVGTRQSGDVDTSLGNSMLNFAILSNVLDLMGVRGDVICNGDDSLVGTNEPLNLLQFEELCREHNMETVIKQPVRTLYEPEFCRCKFVINNAGKKTMMMDPKRLNDIYGMSYTAEPRNYHRYLLEVAYCFASMSRNTYLGYVWYNEFELYKYDFGILKHVDKKLKLFMQRLKPCDTQFTDDHMNVTYHMAWPNLIEEIDRTRELATLVKNRQYARFKTQACDVFVDHDNKLLHVG